MEATEALIKIEDEPHLLYLLNEAAYGPVGEFLEEDMLLEKENEPSLGPFNEILGDGLSSAVNNFQGHLSTECPSILEVEKVLLSKGKVYHCAYCKYGTSWRKKIKHHIYKTHVKLFSKRGSSTIVFDSIRSASPHLLPKRVIKNMKGRNYQAKYTAQRKHFCPHCDYRGGTGFTLNNHILAVHLKVKPISCPLCEFKTVENINLKRHIQAKHTSVKEAACPYCDYRGLHIGNLKHHIILRHTDEGVRCPHCKFRSIHNAHMKRHISLVHLKEKKFSCSTCAYRAGRIGHLQRHILSRHKNEKPYPCPYCDYRFVNKSDLRNHLASKHTLLNNKIFLCPTCDYRGSTKKYLNNHIKKKHYQSMENQKPLEELGQYHSKPHDNKI